MSSNPRKGKRTVASVHGKQKVEPDPPFELDLSRHLRASYTPSALLEHYSRFANGDGELDNLMRRAIWRAVARKFGHGVRIESGVGFKHLETFEIGDGVFIGAQAYIQGRFDGVTKIGNHVWIGPQAYFDARQLILEDYVGWGPGAKVLGSAHTGMPIDRPIMETDLEIRPVHVEAVGGYWNGRCVVAGRDRRQGQYRWRRGRDHPRCSSFCHRRWCAGQVCSLARRIRIKKETGARKKITK